MDKLILELLAMGEYNLTRHAIIRATRQKYQ